MPMTDQHFELFKTFLRVRMNALGLKNDAQAFDIIKMDWDILSDIPELTAQVERAELVQLKNVRDAENLVRPARDLRIAELEAKEAER